MSLLKPSSTSILLIHNFYFDNTFSKPVIMREVGRNSASLTWLSEIIRAITAFTTAANDRRNGKVESGSEGYCAHGQYRRRYLAN